MSAPTIYDWRSSLCPSAQIFVAGGEAVEGGMTLGGVAVTSPEPGGRAELRWGFPVAWRRREQSVDASWTLSRLRNGVVMRLPLWPSPQLVAATALDADPTGQPWATGALWAGGVAWRLDPWVPVAEAAERGAETVRADLSFLGPVVGLGHVVGFRVAGYDFAHLVMDVEYDADDVATLTVSPPLRRAVTEEDGLRLRPRMLGVCVGDPGGGDGWMRRQVELTSLRFVEALV